MQITDQLTQLITQAIEEIGLVAPTVIHLEHPADPTHGDYATNIAMTLFGQLKTQPELAAQYAEQGLTNPRALASKLVEQLHSSAQVGHSDSKLAAISLAGPGFINFTLSEQFLLEEMIKNLSAEHVLVPQINQHQQIVVEFTDPNPFKEFHIGHLYSNSVGESISRLLEATGAHVHRACYQGDVGMHVAKSVWGMKQKLKEEKHTLADLEKLSLNERVKFLGKAYSLGATAYEESEEAKQEMKEINFLTFLSAQEHLKETQGWEPQVDYRQHLTKTKLNYEEIKELYQKGRTWSLEYFNQIYTRLGMKFDDFFFESVVGEYGMKIVKEHLEKGTFRKSEGAIIFPGSEYGLHDRVFVNSLGLPTYECKELGLVPEKYRRFKYDQSIIITGNEIKEYFKVLLAAIMQTEPVLGAKTKHFSHGMVRLPEGKMSSRTGKILTGEWLIEEAKQRIQTIFAETKPDFSAQEADVMAEKVALAAIKYALLKANLGRDIAFNFDESLSFQGNSGPYLQYTFVRALSVLDKAGLNPEKSSINRYFDPLINIKDGFDHSFNVEEKEVLRYIYQYFEVVELAAREFAPHHLCTYLYQLAQAFNVFYTQHTILGEDQTAVSKQFRVALTATTARIIKHGLNLLGIEAIKKM
jgi:arginyl-tRNA synthetase